MSDMPGVSPDGEWRGPHGIGEEWLSFEQRMRRRRAAKCLLRADLAIDDGKADDARAALDEARELDPDASDIGALEERLQALAVAQQPVTTEAKQWRPFRVRPVTVTYAAGLVILGAGAIAFGLPYWTSDPSSAAAGTASAVEAVSPGLPSPTPPPTVERVASKQRDKLEVVYETLRVKEAKPRIVEDLPRLPASPSHPIADADADPVVMAVNRTPTPLPMPATPEVHSDLPSSTPAVRVAAPPPPTSEPEPKPEPSEPETSPPPPPVAVDETATVRAVLRRYEHAYSSLDATEASAVWPGVNRGALARAFGALASQRVSLGSCDVDVTGPAARATCAGSATWEPKVGGGVRTEARLWNFELRKSGDNWRIERAVAR